jgi:hypothetical protein
MSNGENQNDIFVRYPAIFGHIAELVEGGRGPERSLLEP